MNDMSEEKEKMPMSFDHFEGSVLENRHPLENGFEIGQFYERISFEYLRGLLSMLTPLYACMVERYSRWNGDRVLIKDRCVDTFDTIKQRMKSGVDLAYYPDDIYVIAKGEDSYFVLAFCKFKDHRFVGRLSSDDFDVCVNQLVSFLESHKGMCQNTTGNYLSLPFNNMQPVRDYFSSDPSKTQIF